MRVPALLALAATLAALPACRRSPVLPVWTGAGAGPAAPLPARSAGCARAAQAPTGLLERTVKIKHERRYTIIVPREHGASPPSPVVFLFHGRTPMDRPARHQRLLAGGLGAVPGVERTAILVAPQGTPFPKERVVGWYAGCPSDDVDFFDAMLADIEASHCVDPRAVFVAGHSWGSEMALALACCRGERIRAIAAASGSDLAMMPRCPAPRLPAIRATYPRGGDGITSKEEFAAMLAFFRKVHGCQSVSDPVDPAPCVSYRGCAQPVVDCGYRNIGHSLPGDFAGATWRFFSKLLP